MRHLLPVRRLQEDLDISGLDSDLWRGDLARITRYWSGEPASESRSCAAQLLWSDAALYVRFEAARGDELVISDAPVLTDKTLGLWDRDVCEIFVAPDRYQPDQYFEFEVAPTGEWVDLAIEWSPQGRKTDASYRSNMITAARIEIDKVVMAMRIDWEAFGRVPQTGDIWLGNLFRCVGRTPERGYLAWQPTLTEVPNFHVPDAFGEFAFMP
jgi:alpha-galactosidase